ncbi:MAG: TonB-dependent receptor [Halioglobus sp.]
MTLVKKAIPLAISAAICTPLAAQQLEEVVVTAQKRAESLQDVPVAVSAFQTNQLENFGIEDTKSLQMVTPSLVFNNRGPVAQPFIRGIGTTLSLLGLEPSVATYVDDQYYPRPVGSIMELPDIERIEVLKGPQGTLYGRNATGGAIRIVTKDPGDEFSGTVKVSAGNYDYVKVSAYAEGALSDNFRANLSILNSQRDGFAEQQEPGLDDLDDLNVQTYRTKLVWDASESVTAKLALDYTKRKDTAGSETIDITSGKTIIGQVFPFSIGNSFAEAIGGGAPGGAAFGNVQPTGKAQDDVRSSVDKDNELTMFNAQLRFDVDLDGMMFSSMTTYQDTESETNTADFDASSLSLSDISDFEENEAVSQEFQLLSDNDSDLSWMVGTFYFQSEGEYQLLFDGSDLVLTGFQTLVSPQSRLDTTAWAVFGQASYSINDAWVVTLGGRYSDEEKEIKADSPTGVVEDDEEWSEFTPKAVLEYNWDVGMAYLSYSRGFKSGGFSYPYVVGFSDSSVDAEVLDMWELGMKADLVDNTLRLNGALYFYDYSDLQVNRNAGLVPGVGVVIPVENAGGAEIIGLEMDLTWVATDSLTLTAGFNAMDTEYTDYDATPSVYNTENFPGPAVETVDYDAKGDDMIRAPDFSAYISANYEFTMASGAYMPLNITYSHKGDYNFDLIPGDESNSIDEYQSDSYELLNARLGFHSADDSWRVALWGKNLTDEEYFDEVVAFATAVRATVAAPRTYGIDFTYNF